MFSVSTTDTSYHLYKATFRNILEEINIQEPIPTPGVYYYECPGHAEFFHRYVGRERAKRKATQYIQDCYDTNRTIKSAHYKIISKLTPEGKESGYFKGLNRIYNHAIQIIYYHKDNNLGCPHHPFHDTHRPK